jgi:hypothetical protein
MRPKLTIGMPVYDDFDGAYFTLQSLRLHHDLREVELVVVDNKPDAPSSADLKQKVEGWMQPHTAGARYIAAPGPGGPAAAKDRVFREARGDAVLCIDSHVLLAPGAIAQLIAYYDAHPGSHDLIQGPLLLDHLAGVHTHFIDTWRGEMWGIWGSAWEICRHEETAAGDRVSVVEENGRVRFLSLEAGHAPLTSSSRCGFELPADLPYANHEQRLIELGMRPLGLDPNDIFEIPGMGCGLMSCRRTAWPGFNEHFRGFGGEEMYLHEKVRQRGDRCLCLGFLKWLHKFARPGGVKYPLTRWNKVRNYVLGHQELGLPLDRVYEHFVIGGLFSERHWKYLLADPIARVAEPTAGSAETIEELYQDVQSTAWSLNEHMPRLRELAEECFHVTEFSHTRESLVAFAAATESSGGQLVSYNTDSKASAVKPLMQLVAIEQVDSPDVSTIEPTDLLFLDTKHTRDRLAGELAKFAPHVARYIVLHDTVLHGARGEDGGPGLLAAVKDFLKEQPEWFVASHAAHQYGLTVLGRQERDRPAEPIHLWAPGYGPGTELKHILESLGIEPGPTCDCRARADQMDAWGVAGCLTNRDQIIQWMRDGQSRWGWRDKLAAAAKAVQIGLAFKLNPLDPFPSLIDEAIRRADKEQGVPA